MSVHIDNAKEVTALLIAGSWLGVDKGSLERKDPVHGSSGSTNVIYRWVHGGYRYQAMAADIIAIQMALPAA